MKGKRRNFRLFPGRLPQAWMAVSHGAQGMAFHWWRVFEDEAVSVPLTRLAAALGLQPEARRYVGKWRQELVDSGALRRLEGGDLRMVLVIPSDATSTLGERSDDATSTLGERYLDAGCTLGERSSEPKHSESLGADSAKVPIQTDRQTDGTRARAQGSETDLKPAPERLISVLLEELGSEAFERDLQPAPSAPPGQLRTAAERVQQLVRAGRFPEPRGAARALVRAALDLARDHKRPFGLALLDATVAAPPPPVTEADLRPKRPSWWQEESA